MRDPYATLGVKRDAGSEEIKAAWRAKVKLTHPDINADDPQATSRFAEIGQAYDLLKDPRRRQLYDQARSAAERKNNEQTIMQKRRAAQEAAARAKAADELMAELQKNEAKKTQARSESRDGRETRTESAEDMIERIFGVRPQQPNSDAQDGAKTDKADGETNGTVEQGHYGANALPAINFVLGLIKRLRGTAPLPEKAPDMTAEAIVSTDDLLRQKWISVTLADERNIRFQLEAGITDGNIMRIAGQGLKLPEMARGDVVVTIRVARNEAFTVREFDIHTVLPIKLEDAVLGCETTILSPSGEIQITVPAWSGSDHNVRIEGKGLPRGDGTFGDFVIELRVMLLEKPDEKVTDLMRHMREGLYL